VVKNIKYLDKNERMVVWYGRHKILASNKNSVRHTFKKKRETVNKKKERILKILK